MKLRQYHAQLVQSALDAGLTLVSVVANGKNHLYISALCPNGEFHKVFASKSPSEYRWKLNHSRNCKTVVKQYS